LIQVATETAPALGEYFPATQSWQTEINEAATAIEYFPLGQPVQAAKDAAPASTEYFPATQLKQTGVGGEEGVGMEAGEVEGVGEEVKGGQLPGKGVPLMVAP